jgi:hypothetical protein
VESGLGPGAGTSIELAGERSSSRLTRIPDLKLYGQLWKAESLVLSQARIRRISLQKFLALVRIPGIESEEYLYRDRLEIAEYTLLFCISQPRDN